MFLEDLNNREVLPFYKGRVALHAILTMAGIGPGDEVLLPGYTCVVVPNAIQYVGATPVFIDIDPLSYGMNPDCIRGSLGHRWHRGRAKAMIVQHTYGIPAVMSALKDLANEYDLLVIEDSCHALGSSYAGTPVGSLGDAAFFSSQWSKPITTGLGGWAILPPDSRIKPRASVLAQYSKPSTFADLLLHAQYLAYRLVHRPSTYWTVQNLYRVLGRMGVVIGSSSSDELDCRLPPQFCKTMGPIQLWRLKRGLLSAHHANSHRKMIVSRLEQRLKTTAFVTCPSDPLKDIVYLRYPIRVSNKYELLRRAASAHVELGDWFLSPVHPLEDRWERAGYQRGSCPEAERACDQVINVPTHGQITPSHLDHILSFIDEFATKPSQQEMPIERYTSN
jgi:perosamine synthetase